LNYGVDKSDDFRSVSEYIVVISTITTIFGIIGVILVTIKQQPVFSRGHEHGF
jgi:hypothetical protein